jgi:hypothetical protein
MRPSPPINYQVSQSQLVTEQFLELFARAEQLGFRTIFLEASRYMIDELAYEPLRFGESRGILPNLELEMRIAFAPPLYVEFAVNEQSHQVFIRHFGMRVESD